MSFLQAQLKEAASGSSESLKNLKNEKSNEEDLRLTSGQGVSRSTLAS